MNLRFVILNAICLFGAITVWADEKMPVLRTGSEVYSNVLVTKITTTDIYFTYNNGTGMANAKLSKLDSGLQKHFGYNAAKAGKVEDRQAQSNAAYQKFVVNQPVLRPPDETRVNTTSEGQGQIARTGLGLGSKFPNFSETDLNGNPVSVSSYRGKVLLVDFWATWCGPCRAELPNVIATYQKHRAEGFEIIGVSLDTDRGALETFLKQTDGMTWQQYFDGQGWENKLAVEFGVHSIPSDVLIGPDGTIIGISLRGQQLEAAVAATLAQR